MMTDRQTKLVTLTLNPALDRTIYLRAPLVGGALNRAAGMNMAPGSKGINVARAAARLGAHAVSCAFFGGGTGAILKELLDAEEFENVYVPAAAPTRINIKLTAPDGTGTEVNEAGGAVSEAERDALRAAYLAAAEDADIVHLGGSLPPGVEKTFYRDLIFDLHRMGKRCALDADGEALAAAMEAAPDLIKPNLHELEELVGAPIADADEALRVSRALFERTGVDVLCTLGDAGAVYAGARGEAILGAVPDITVRGFAGAGDTFLAAYLVSEQTMPLADSLRLAASAAAEKVASPNDRFPTREALCSRTWDVPVRFLRENAPKNQHATAAAPGDTAQNNKDGTKL